MYSTVGKISFCLVIILYVCSIAFGQTTFGSITGTVTDPSGAVLPKVQVILTNVSTNTQSLAATNAEGIYVFVNVLPGNYQLSAQSPNFKRFSRSPIVVQVQEAYKIDISLELGNTAETVSVTTAAPLLEEQTSSLGQVIAGRAVNEMPLNGRNVFQLMSLAPSVVPEGNTQVTAGLPSMNGLTAWNDYQMNGAWGNESAVYLDGVPLNLSYLNAPSFIPTLDSIQEFKIQTNNLGPEWGNFAGGVLNLSTKAGSNQIHGQMYEYLRNKVLNADTFFNNRAGIPRAPYAQNQFGANAGGPIYIPGIYNGKDKTFWFFSYEGFRLRQGQTFVETVPTAAERAGDFSGLKSSSGNLIPIYDPTSTQLVNGNYVRQQISCNSVLNVICPGKINLSAAAMLKLWPSPNTTGQTYTNVNNWIGNASAGSNDDQQVVRIDQTFSQKQHMFGRYSHRTDFIRPVDPFGTGVCSAGCSSPFSVHDFVMDDTYAFSPTFFSDIHLSYDRFAYNRTPKIIGVDLSSIGWPASLNSQIPASVRGLPITVVSGLDNLFSSSGLSSVIIDRSNTYTLSGALTKIVGRHTFSFGTQWWLSRDNHGQTNTASGTFSFTPTYTSSSPTQGAGGFGFASFLLGYPASGSSTVPSLIAGQQVNSALYFGDTWQVTNTLALNLGLRYDRMGPWSERYDCESFWDLSAPNPLMQSSTLPALGILGVVNSALRSSRNDVNRNNLQFGPRVGFAYTMNRQTVIRGGYGLFWFPEDVIFTSSPVLDAVNSFTTPYVDSTNGGITPTGTFANPYPSGIVPPPGHSPNTINQTILNVGGATAVSPNNKFGFMEQWNLDIQRELPKEFVLDLAYAASSGTNLPGYTQNMNQLPDQFLSMGANLLQTVSNPYYGIIASGPLSSATTTRGQLLRPYPEYTSVLIAGGSYGVSSYNSLQVKVQRRFKGQTILAAYTFSKLLTDNDSPMSWLEGTQGGVPAVVDWNNIRGSSYTRASEDDPERLVASYVLDLPFGRDQRFLSHVTGVGDGLISGWGVNGIVTFESGYPLKLGTASNLTNSNGGGSTPNVVAGCSQNASGSREDRLTKWFNTSCFTQPPAFTYGNEPRVDPYLRGDGIKNFDFAAFKGMKFGERLDVQFRGEFFNFFNRPQFGVPGETVGLASVGVVSSQANDPRLIQFGLDVHF